MKNEPPALGRKEFKQNTGLRPPTVPTRRSVPDPGTHPPPQCTLPPPSFSTGGHLLHARTTQARGHLLCTVSHEEAPPHSSLWPAFSLSRRWDQPFPPSTPRDSHFSPSPGSMTQCLCLQLTYLVYWETMSFLPIYLIHTGRVFCPPWGRGSTPRRHKLTPRTVSFTHFSLCAAPSPKDLTGLLSCVLQPSQTMQKHPPLVLFLYFPSSFPKSTT